MLIVLLPDVIEEILGKPVCPSPREITRAAGRTHPGCTLDSAAHVKAPPFPWEP